MFRFASLLTILAALVLTTAGTSQEKDKKTKGQLPQGWKALDLSAEQKQKAYTIMADYRKKVDALENQIKDMKLQERAELVKLLTEEQKKKLTAGLTGEKTDPKKTDK